MCWGYHQWAERRSDLGLLKSVKNRPGKKADVWVGLNETRLLETVQLTEEKDSWAKEGRGRKPVASEELVHNALPERDWWERRLHIERVYLCSLTWGVQIQGEREAQLILIGGDPIGVVVRPEEQMGPSSTEPKIQKKK